MPARGTFTLAPRAVRTVRFAITYPSVIDVTGCISQIVGIRLFRLAGPGRWPVACVMSKNSEAWSVIGIGGS